MRRYLAYLLLCGLTAVGVGASVVPTIRNMDADLAYADGRTLYFKAADYDDATLDGNYTGPDGNTLEYIPTLTKQPIEYIADTMRERLDNFSISGYKVETQGYDTIAVTLRTAGDKETLYSYLENYLPFSGGDFSIDASDTSQSDYPDADLWTSILDGQTAEIVDMDQGTYKIPVVVIPIKSGDEYVDAFKKLVEYCKNNTAAADEQAGTEAKSCNIVVWANRDPEVDTFAASADDSNVAKKIVSVVNPANAVYYASKADEENETNPYLRLIPSSAATSGESYDPTKTSEAYQAAKALMLTMNAGSFEYEDIKVGDTKQKFVVNFTYSEKSPASVEAFVIHGDWNQDVAMSATLISILVGALFLAVLLIIFERAMAALHIATAMIGGFSSLAVFVAFGAPFNIAALIGLVTGVMATMFGTLYYSAKLKQEIYKGRTLKKAHAEAVRKSLLPTLDVAVILVLVGVCLYGLAGDVASKAGIMLVLMGFFGFVANLVFTRIVGWMFCNDSFASNNFPKLLGVRSERIPDLAKDEKPSYFGPFADRDFGKGKKVSAIVLCAFVLAGLGGAIGFGVAGGNYFNSAAYETSAPVLRIDVRSPDSSNITNYSSFADALELDANFNVENGPRDLYHFYKVNDKYLADYVSNVSVSASPKSVYYGESGSGETYYWFYYAITLGKSSDVFNKQLSEAAPAELKVEKWNGSAYAVNPNVTSLPELAGDIITEYASGGANETTNGAFVQDVVITFNSVVPATLTPYLWQVTLGLGVAAATVLVYLCLRYRPSRGLVAGLIATFASFVATAFFILTRISTVPAISLGSIGVLVLGVVIALFILAAEKEIFREAKEKDKNTPEFRGLCLSQAASREAGNVFLFALLCLYVAVVCLFGPRIYATAYIGMIIGLALAVMAIMTLLAPTGAALGKKFAAIQLGRPGKVKKKKKSGGQLLKKKASAEPEESIFIGIND